MDSVSGVWGFKENVPRGDETTAGAGRVGHPETKTVICQSLFCIDVGAPLIWWFVPEAEPDTEDEGGVGIKRCDAWRDIIAELIRREFRDGGFVGQVRAIPTIKFIVSVRE